MRNFRCLPALAAFFTVAALSAAPVLNLAPDPGFEQKTGWSLTSWEICEYKSEYVSEAHSGQTAIKLNPIKPGKDNKINAIALSPAFAVKSDTDYLVSMWVRTDADSPIAAFSIMAFREPFATKGFKTPQAGYSTFSLPASKTWRLWTLRYHMPPGAVEAILAPRVSRAGTAWFDDLSFVRADQASLTFPLAGQVVKLPDTRRFEAETACPAGTACRVELYCRETGEKLASAPAAASVALSPATKAGDWLDAVLVEPKSNSILAHTALRTPPLVEFALAYPSYRRTLYAASKRDRVEGHLTINAASEIAEKLTYTAAVTAGDASPAFPAPRPCAPEQTIRLPLPKSSGHNFTLAVQVTTPSGPQTFREPFKLVSAAPTGTHEFIVGDHNELLMDGKPFFVRAFMGGDASNFGPLVEAGYNCGFTFSNTPESAIKYLDGLQKIGMYGCVGVPVPFVNKRTTEGLREAIAKVKNHPALMGYYLIDEPAPTKEGQTPKDLQAYYDIVADEDPYHPAMTTFYNPEFADDYENCLDIFLFDPYPVKTNRLPLTMVSQFVLRARELLGDRKPVHLVPQAFGWEIIEGLNPPYPYTTPTPQEARCMSYLGLATGANGLIYYCWHVYTKFDQKVKDQGGWPWTLGGYLPEKQPALWGALAQVGRETRMLEPVLQIPGRMWSQDGVYFREIPPTTGQLGYLFAVNPSDDKPVTTTIRLQTRLPRLHELEEINRATRCAKVAGSEVTISLQPQEVGIYKLPTK